LLENIRQSKGQWNQIFSSARGSSLCSHSEKGIGLGGRGEGAEEIENGTDASCFYYELLLAEYHDEERI
jgi:hypothetical protein